MIEQKNYQALQQFYYVPQKCSISSLSLNLLHLFLAHSVQNVPNVPVPTQNKTFARTTRWRLLSAQHVEAASRLVTALQQRPSLTGTASAVSRRVHPPFTCMDTNWGILVKATFWREAIQKETSAKLHNFNPLGPLKGMGFVLLCRSYLFAGDYSHLHPSWQELIKEKSRGNGGV